MAPGAAHQSRIASRIGAIFDWDGVIIDSHDQHERSWFLLAEEIGKPLTREQFTESFGMRNESIIPGVFHWAAPGDHERIRALGDRKEDLYREIIRVEGIDPLPGVAALLESLAEARIPCAVGSSTPRENIDCIIEILGFTHCFEAITAAADVRHGKPDPEVFLTAARKISRAPADCVVFEDAGVGIEAGRRAGMKTIGVTTTHPAETLKAADLVVDSLTKVGIPTIVALFS